MALACLDTHVLIWGVKGEATEGQESMIPRARAFLGGSDGVEFIVTSVVIGEFLMKIPFERHAEILDLMRGSFQMPPYDVKAASLHAKIQQQRESDGTFAALKADGVHREKIKADAQIVATAIAQDADYIISHDPYLSRFAGDLIEVRELPTGSEQIELLDEEEA